MLIASTVSLALGLLIGGMIGGYIEVRYWHRRMDEALSWQSEAFHRVQAVDSVNYIQLLDAGKTQEAVRMMAKPISLYYYLDARDAKSLLDRWARTNIDRVASSNRIVASVMASEKAFIEGK